MAKEKIESGGGPGVGCVVVSVAFLAVVCMIISAGRMASDKELGLRVDKLEARIQALEKKVTDMGDRASEADLIVNKRPSSAVSKEDN